MATRSLIRAGLLATLAAAPAPAAGQGAVLDAGTFLVMRGGAVVGREDFTVRRGRSSASDGFTIATSVAYPPTSPRVTLSQVVEVGPDSLPVQVQFDVFGDGQRRVYVRFGPRRITVRVVRPGGESARELPASGRELVADDSVFALYALLPGPGRFQLIWPRSGGRGVAEVADLGTERTPLTGVAHELRHVVLRLGSEERHLWYDRDGKLMKVELPALGLTAERVSRAR